MKNVSYAAYSTRGNVRSCNQDNLYCPDGYMLPEKNNGMRTVRCGSACPDLLFAVFDGMGGESAGETAAWIAADALKRAAYGKTAWGKSAGAKTGHRHIWFPGKFFRSYVRNANAEIERYRVSRKYSAMGTTVAAVLVKGSHVFTCNVGDSRIYRYCGGQLQLLSEDHVQAGSLFRNAPLTQFLGIPEQEMVIMPCIGRYPYTPGDRYLLCTDGIWNYGNDEIIRGYMAENTDPAEGLRSLFAMADEYGSTDNATAILVNLA